MTADPAPEPMSPDADTPAKSSNGDKPKRRRVVQRVVDSYNGQPCAELRPDDAPIRPGEPCGQIHLCCRGHVRARTEREERIIKRGDPCGLPAIPGGVVCRLHGGATPQVRRAAAARLAADKATGEVAVILEAATEAVAGRNPVEAFDDARQRAGAMVLALGMAVGQLAFQADAKVKVVYDDKGAPHVIVKVREEGLVGPNHAGDLAAHPLVKLYGEWLDRSARIEKIASDAGLEERRVVLEEANARGIHQVITETLAELGVELDERVRGIVAAKLRALDPGDVVDTTAQAITVAAEAGAELWPGEG